MFGFRQGYSINVLQYIYIYGERVCVCVLDRLV